MERPELEEPPDCLTKINMNAFVLLDFNSTVFYNTIHNFAIRLEWTWLRRRHKKHLTKFWQTWLALHPLFQGFVGWKEVSLLTLLSFYLLFLPSICHHLLSSYLSEFPCTYLIREHLFPVSAWLLDNQRKNIQCKLLVISCLVWSFSIYLNIAYSSRH